MFTRHVFIIRSTYPSLLMGHGVCAYVTDIPNCPSVHTSVPILFNAIFD